MRKVDMKRYENGDSRNMDMEKNGINQLDGT